MSKPHNPTPKERDERFSLYGLDPDKVGETILQAPSSDDRLPKATKKKRGRRESNPRSGADRTSES